MNDNILHAIESLCYDITTSAKAEENQKRANAILALAFAGKFTPEESEEDYTEEDSAAGAEKDKIKFPKPGEQFEYNGVEFTASERNRAACLPLFRNRSRRKCRSIKAIKMTGAPPRSVNTLTENTSNNSTAATSYRLYRT